VGRIEFSKAHFGHHERLPDQTGRVELRFDLLFSKGFVFGCSHILTGRSGFVGQNRGAHFRSFFDQFASRFAELLALPALSRTFLCHFAQSLTRAIYKA
jgi:hypothetical protein